MDQRILVMWSIKQIAERDGLTRAAVSKAVKKLLTAKPETPVDRGPQGQVLRISLADYDHHRERISAVSLAPGVRAVSAPADSASRYPGESYEEARRQSEWLKVHRENLQRQVDRGLLLDAHETRNRLTSAGREIAAIIARLPNYADEMASAVSEGGAPGVRNGLQVVAAQIWEEIEDRIASLTS